MPKVRLRSTNAFQSVYNMLNFLFLVHGLPGGNICSLQLLGGMWCPVIPLGTPLSNF